jgi:hypothetical protein
MAYLTEVRDAACQHLKALLPAVRISGLAGGADAATLLRESTGLTTIFVVLLSAENKAHASPMDFDMNATLGALIVLHGRKDQTMRETDGLAVAETVAQALHGQNFGLNGVSAAYVLGLAPLADEELASKGLWAWAVTWEQGLTFSALQGG